MTIQMSKLMLKSLVIGALLLFVVSSCNKVYDHKMRSYVHEYCIIDSVSVVAVEDTYRDLVHLELWPRMISGCNFLNRNVELYDEICRANGDMSYNRVNYLILNIMEKRCITPNIASIEVVSDKDFDIKHPAGLPINDCIILSFTSAYDYVKNGYKGEDPLDSRERKLISDLCPEDLKMLLCYYGITPVFIFEKSPEILDVHTLTFKVTLEDGTVSTSSVQYDFSRLSAN